MEGTNVGNKMEKLIELFEIKTLQIGEKIETFMEKTTPRKKYICGVLLRVPLLFIIHQWLLVSPYSDYRVFEFLLLIVRYAVVTFLSGSLAFNTGVALVLYAAIICDILMLWLQQINYWTIQEDTYEICFEKNTLVWTDVLQSWRPLAVFTVLFQQFYLWFRIKTLACRSKKDLTFIYRALAILTVFLDVTCILGMLSGWLSELSFWVKSLTFAAIIFLEIFSLFYIDSTVDKKKLQSLQTQLICAQDQQQKLKLHHEYQFLQDRIDKRNQGKNFFNRLPGKWFFRDTYLAFGILYIWFMFLFEILVTGRPLLSFTLHQTVLEILAMWCTSLVVLFVLSTILGIMSNFCVAFCYFFLSTEFTLLEVIDANIGSVVETVSLTTLLETDILSKENSEKTDALEIVCFFSFNAIIDQIFDVLSKKVLHAVNSGASPGLCFYFKVAILSGLLVMVPSLATYHLSKNFFIDPWILFFASGNCMLMIRMLFLVVDSSLVMLKWHATRNIDKFEDAVHYFQISKNVISIVVIIFQTYFRLTCGLFKASWFIRIALALINLIRVVFLFYKIEQNRSQARQKLMSIMDSLVDVSYELRLSRETPNVNDDQKEQCQDDSTVEETEKDPHDCTICYSKIVDGKMLPCGHAFHKDCIKRWIGIKFSCPFCNTQIHV